MSNTMADLSGFVLKLKFQGSGEDDTQIRRVRLPRICTGPAGTVSYEELVGLAISFIIPERPANTSDFQVKLTYYDCDGDNVIFSSTQELLDALDQFKEQRVLRITAEVKRATKAVPLTQPPSPQQDVLVPSSRALSRGVVDNKSRDTACPPNNSTGPRSPVLQNVVESVVNIILNAAVAINGSEAPPPTPPAVYYTPEGVPSGASSGADDEELHLPKVQAEKGNLNPPQPENSSTALAVVPPVAEETKVAPEAKLPQVEEPTKGEPPKEELKEGERPFIHGRHTCDNCLCTPIVGPRYHAVNMSDYDLCGKCFSNYGGSGEIQFEVVELERDRQFQNRWHRRRERMNGKGGGRGPAPRLGPRGHHTRWGPPVSVRRGPPAHVRPQSRPVALPPVPPAATPSPPVVQPQAWKGRAEQESSEEIAMAQAIRLSIQAMNKLPATAPKAPAPSAPVEPPKVAHTANVAKSITNDPSSESEPAPVPVLVENVDSRPEVAPPAPSAPTEDDLKPPATTTSKAVEVETVEDDDMDGEEPPTESSPFMVRMPSCDGSFSSEVSCIKSQGSNAPAVNPPAKESQESSFSSDAAGNGEIADMLGETLDKCAEAINAMVSELDRTSLDVASTVSSYVGVNDGEESVRAVEEGTATDGATILESVGAEPNQEDDDAASERSEEGWHVVNENNNNSSDEDLARAAQMIGSALFNSDMRSSGEVVSNLTGSAAELDGMSHASSALTSVPSVTSQVAGAQRQRWASQLAQLRTLGIDDEARCVEILERLTAANIGCGSTDEVSVTAVVDALWN